MINVFEEPVDTQFQNRTIRELFAHTDILCPCCHHDYDISVSRTQLQMTRMQRLLFRRWRCGVCGCRFSTLNLDAVKRYRRIGFCVATAVVTVIATIALV